MIKISAIPAFNDNYIWCLYDTVSSQALVVDPGDAAPVIEFIETNGLTLCAVLITHHHFDHTGGIEALNQRYSATVFGPVNEQISAIDNRLGDGERIELLGLEFSVLEIPGHTLDHIAYFSADVTQDSGNSAILFCGDTLFAGGCGRIFEGTPAMMKASLDRLAELPDNTQVFCAHEYTLANLAFATAVEPGNVALQQRIKIDQQKRADKLPTVPSSIHTEKATNPFLRYHIAEVITSATQHKPSEQSDDVAVFATLREWKNNF